MLSMMLPESLTGFSVPLLPNTEPAPARAAALLLANRLAMAMDRRSTSCLFVPTAFRDDDKRRVILWIFPRDEAFRLRTGNEGPTIEVLENIFSQKSKHRKAAMFEGRNLRNHFLSGRVLGVPIVTVKKTSLS
jgi:hypothetical protein